MIQRIREALKAAAGLSRKGFRPTAALARKQRKPAATGYMFTASSWWSHQRARKGVVR